MRKALAVITVLLLASASFVSGDSIWGDSEILQMLSSGQQGEAETKLGEILRRNPENNACAFLAAVCARSRFDTNGSAPGFLATMKNKPESPEGLASACVLGIDASTDKATALYYFNALLILSEQNPRSIPIHWLAAVMTRTLTRNENSQLSPDVRKRILQCGIREYETVLSLMAPGSGPALIHQTLANLLDDVEAYDASWKHREIAIKMERSPWSLHAGAETLRSLERAPEALPLLQEAIAKTPQNAGYHHSLGNALWSLERREEAVAEWDSASRIEPNNQRYLRLCAMGCRGLGDYTSARKYTWTALAKDPDNRDIRIWDARFAALAGEPDAKEKLLKAGSFDFNGNPVDFETNPDLWFGAVETGDLKSFRELLGSADINAPDQKYFHQTALMKAAQSGWEPIVAELIRSGADLNLADDNRDTALHYSAQFGHTRVMKLLLDAGANPDLQDKWKQTPLILCACTCNRDGFRVLMDKNVGIELATPHGGTALQNASRYGQLAMVSELLARGANANHSSQNAGETPLIAACKWNHAQIVIPLLSAGADVKARDHSGRTALHYAIAPILNVPLVELLLEKGADPTVADNNGVTPITQARLLGFEGMAEEMEKKAGAPEPFLFPPIASPDSALSAGEQKASQFVIPILLAQGHRPERDGGDPRGNKQAAIKELSQMSGIKDAAALKEEILALEEFQSRLREAGNLPRGTASGNFQNMLKAAAWKIHASCKKNTQDESAWTKSHVIYLADLGMSAGFLDSEEGAKLVREASKVLSGRFSSWPEFSRSFVLGAQLHNGWEAQRYEHICSRLLAANLSWP